MAEQNYLIRSIEIEIEIDIDIEITLSHFTYMPIPLEPLEARNCSSAEKAKEGHCDSVKGNFRSN